MDLTRRSFFGGALALVAATQLPVKAFGTAPVIHGDGVHDDTAGLQAAFDGKPFRVRGEGIYVVNKGGQVRLSGGRFRLTDTLHISGTAIIENVRLDASEIVQDGRPVIQMRSNSIMGVAKNVAITGSPVRMR